MNQFTEELKFMRATLQTLCEATDRLIVLCQNNGRNDPQGQSTEHAANPVAIYESIFPLCMENGFFKGKSVIAVIFPDGVRIETPTWKALVEVIMKRCNDDAAKHTALMDLRNRVQGRTRKLLGNSAAGMRSPIKIDRGLYMETHYDTETLLRVLKARILEVVGYDFSAIRVAIRNC